MSRKLSVLLSMLVLVGAMSLKAAVASQGDVTAPTPSASGAPPPPMPW